MTDEDNLGYIVEDMLGKAEQRSQRKRKDSGAKGHRGELELAKLFNKQFDSQVFARVVGSGNRWGQVAFVKKDYIGDLVTPDDFRFTIEAKHGYPEIDLYGSLSGGNATLDDWLNQAEEEAVLAQRAALLCWRKERHEWLSFVKTTILSLRFDYEIKYRDWTGTPLSNLFTLNRKFWFNPCR